MRYYLYRDIDLLKELYSQFNNLRLDLDAIEHIDAKNSYEEQAVAVAPHSNLLEKCELKLGADARRETGNSVTTISEYVNIEDVKEIYNKRFFHNLINNIRDKKILCDGLCIETGSMNCLRLEENIQDKFVIVNGIYVWFDSEKMSNDMRVISSITDNIEVIGVTIKEAAQNSPKVIKAIAIYVDMGNNVKINNKEAKY